MRYQALDPAAEGYTRQETNFINLFRTCSLKYTPLFLLQVKAFPRLPYKKTELLLSSKHTVPPLQAGGLH